MNEEILTDFYDSSRIRYHSIQQIRKEMRQNFLFLIFNDVAHFNPTNPQGFAPQFLIPHS